jgi:capsular polysaccharide biosynthesis protein
MNAIAGLVLGVLIGALIVLALEWMSADVLATVEGVERCLGLPVLGAIPASVPLAQHRDVAEAAKPVRAGEANP